MAKRVKKSVTTNEKRNTGHVLWQTMKILFVPFVVRFSFLSLLLSISVMAITGAVYLDIEGTNGNTFASGTLDFTLTSPAPNFATDSAGMKPGTIVTRDVTVENTGTLPLLYRGQYQYTSGDTELCDALTLKITKGSTTLYTGFLSSFLDFTTQQSLTPGSSDSLVFTVTLPLSTPASMSGKTCAFSLPFVGWQTDTTEALAGFKDSETLDGNILGTADFEAPPTPIIYQNKDDAILNSSNLKDCWSIVSDPQNLHNPVTYEYERYSDSGFTTQVETQSLTELTNTEVCGLHSQAIVKHRESAPEGNVYYRIRAVDSVGNASTWATAHYLIDNTAPSTAISVSNSPARTISEAVLNSGFESVDGNGKPTDWTIEGDVHVVGAEHGVTPFEGSRMAKIGRSTDPGQDYTLNFISQPIPNSAKNISFWFNFLSYDYVGYDEPGFAVFINDKMVYQMWARDIAGAGNPNSSGWRQFLYDISSIPQGEQPILTIVFHAGNTGDPTYQSWVYVDQVSTSDVVVNNHATFTLTPSDNLTTPTPWYQIGTNGTSVQGNSFQLSSRPLGDVIHYWSVDQAGNEETPHKSLHVIYDNDRPDPIHDLSAIDWGDGEISLNFTAVDPHDTVTGSTTATAYDIRYATSPITNDTEFNAATATDSASPRPSGEHERIFIKGLEKDVQYWFAVKAKDAAPNTSLLENGSTATNGPTVVLNEFMADPTGADNAPMPGGEWVELYNNAGYDIDVANWKLYDSDNSHELSITPANTNTGATIVPSLGFLVVYRNGSGTFSLNNTTDTLRLYNKSIATGGRLIDSYTYASVTTNKTSARIPDGTGAWVDPKGTPGQKNTTEQGSYTIGQHEPDEEPVPTPTQSSTPTPTPTSAGGPTPTSNESTPSGKILGADTTVTPTPSPVSTPIPTTTPTPTGEPTPNETPSTTPTPVPTGTT